MANSAAAVRVDTPNFVKMCSMWLPTVFCEMCRARAIYLGSKPPGEVDEDLDLPGRKAAGMRAAPSHSVAGRPQHYLDRLDVEASCLHLRPHLDRCFLGRAARSMRSRLGHSVVNVGGRQNPRRGSQRCSR